jgi:hypothetical protein
MDGPEGAISIWKKESLLLPMTIKYNLCWLILIVMRSKFIYAFISAITLNSLPKPVSVVTSYFIKEKVRVKKV